MTAILSWFRIIVHHLKLRMPHNSASKDWYSRMISPLCTAARKSMHLQDLTHVHDSPRLREQKALPHSRVPCIGVRVCLSGKG